MSVKVLDICGLLKREGVDVFLHGENYRVTNFSTYKHRSNGSLVFVSGLNDKYPHDGIEFVIICNQGFCLYGVESKASFILTPYPKLAFAIASSLFPKQGYVKVIGEGTEIHESVNIGHDGIGYVWGLDGKKWPMPQIGNVIIGNDCFIGPNVCIARGNLRDTEIGDGVNIAPNASIGHGCHIGNDVFIGSNCSIGGSVEIENKAWIGLGAVINPQVKIAENVVIGAGSVVLKDIPKPYTVWAGNPAKFLKKVEKGEKLHGMPAY